MKDLQALFRTEGSTEDPVKICDPSDKFRPEKAEELFRNYTSDGAYFERVHRTYKTMHTMQTYEAATERKRKWCEFKQAELSIWEALDLLNSLLDESDPDNDLPNSVHALQTAERIREVHPDNDWFQLTGLIHDLGKVMAVWGEQQWAVVGDTFPVGCAPAPSVVFGTSSFSENPDMLDSIYSTKMGLYEEHCGLKNVTMSWGHDEYLYQVLKKHKACTLPEETMYMIRYHSFYPWHTGKDYNYLCDENDLKMLPWVLEFNKFDLYSKADAVPDPVKLIPYYQALIDKYIPGTIQW